MYKIIITFVAIIIFVTMDAIFWIRQSIMMYNLQDRCKVVEEQLTALGKDENK